ncbi:MAG: hypothetical protein ACLQMO_09605 [Acidobacteriaceae bacterium]
MTKQNSQGPENDVSMERNQPKTPPSPVPKEEDDREYDHRGVAMPRRTRIGGIIMPQ